MTLLLKGTARDYDENVYNTKLPEHFIMKFSLNYAKLVMFAIKSHVGKTRFKIN